MAATKHSEAELQLLHLSIVGTLQAVRMLEKHQRRCRRSLSELSRLTLAFSVTSAWSLPQISGKIGERQATLTIS